MTPELELCPVDPTRLSHGEWNAGRHTGEGDITASYSADRIAEGAPIRSPFEHGGHLWCCVSISGKGLNASGETEFQAYRLVPPQMFKGEPTTYSAKTAINGGDFARGDPLGFYNGVQVKCGGKIIIMSGPPAIFTAEVCPERPAEVSEAQLSLFEL